MVTIHEILNMATLTMHHAAEFPMHQAAKEGDLERVRQLIEGGESVDSRDDKGRTPLQWAAQQGWYEVATLLIDRGCDLNPKDCDGHVPLWLAVREGRKDVVDLLIERGAQVNCAVRYGWTPLHLATVCDHPGLVLALLEKEGLNLNPRDGTGRTPLHWACFMEHQDTIKQLLEAGADPNIENNARDTALGFHIRGHGKPEIIRLLLQHGAFFEECDFWILSWNPVLKENVLKDADLCALSIVNKFHHQSLPTLYRNPYLARNLPNIVQFKLRARQIEEVEKLVKHEIDKNPLCQIFKVRPMALSALCVRSLIDNASRFH